MYDDIIIDSANGRSLPVTDEFRRTQKHWRQQNFVVAQQEESKINKRVIPSPGGGGGGGNYHDIKTARTTGSGRILTDENMGDVEKPLIQGHKKIISFGLFAGSSKYGEELPPWLEKGIWANIQGYHFYFPEWICRFYYVPPPKRNETNKTQQPYDVLLQKLRESTIPVEIVEMEDWGHYSVTTIQRFLPFDDPDVDIFLARDLDSRPSIRELLAVNEWIGSSSKFHIMRDHPKYHNDDPIMGGMFGAKRGALGENQKVSDLINKFLAMNKDYDTMDDQYFLRTFIWPIVQKDAFQHSPKQTHNTPWCNDSDTKRGCYEFPMGSIGWDDFHIGHPFKTDDETGRSFLFDQYQCFSTCAMGPLDCQCQAQSYKMHHRKDYVIVGGSGGPDGHSVDWKMPQQAGPEYPADFEKALADGTLSNHSLCPDYDCETFKRKTK